MKASRNPATATLLLVTAVLFSPSLAAGGDPVPLDPLVRTGKLANGLTYFIRKNAKPEKQVELRLAVDAGSVEEDDDQRGMAHLLEHMGFRGTAHYPGDNLIHYLQSQGANFGPDVNAHTGFDETVYALSLPSGPGGSAETGIGILADWAHGDSLESAAIDKERKVVLEEWRLGRGAEQRMSDKIVPVLFKDSRYAVRLPIGTRESIEGSSAEAVRRFYRDWYRPDNIAVVVVGDIDPARIESEIKADFGGIQAAVLRRKAPAAIVPDNKEPLYAVVSDKENPYNVVAVIWKAAPEHCHTTADYRRDLTETLFSAMLNLRLAELREQAAPPFLGAQAGFGRLMVRAKAGFQLAIVAAPGGIERGLRAAYTEVLRVQRHGFTQPELDRAKATILKQLEQAYDERDKTPSAQLAETYVRNYLQDDPAPGIAFLYRFARAQVPAIGLAEVNAVAGRRITPENRVFVVKSIEKPGVAIPSAATVRAVVAEAEASKIASYAEKRVAGALMSYRPVPGRIAGAKPLKEIQAMELDFANGVRVVLKPTDFQNDEILLSAYRPGGQSVFPDDYVLSARIAGNYLSEAGAGRFSDSDLRKLLAGKEVSLTTNLAPYYDNLRGKSSSADFETLLQLVYLTFSEPRVDRTAYSASISRQRALVLQMKANPIMAFVDQANRYLFRGHPRTEGVVPTEADWETITFEKIKAIEQARFSSAAGFTFEIVGSFDLKTTIPLIQSYLGGLPGGSAMPGWKDRGLRMIGGPADRSFSQGAAPLSMVLFAIQTPAEWTMEEGHRFWSLGNILQRTLLDRLRLDIGGIYNLQVKASFEKTPYGHTEFVLAMPCAPANADALAKAALAEIDRIRRDGPTADEVQKEVESQRRTMEKESRDNDAWRWKLEMVYRDQLPLWRISEPQRVLDLITAPALKSVAVRYLDTGKFVRMTLYPASGASAE